MNASRSSSSVRAARLLQGMGIAAALMVALAAPRAALADVPGRVGRIAFMEGDVQAYSETEPEWKVAYVNEPITSRNSIFVGDGGRAEISVGSTTLAMDGGSQVDIQQLDDNTFNANVVRGRVSMRVRRLDPGDAYNVAVPGAAFALLQPGRYRIDALEASSGISVFAGQASVQSDAAPTTVPAGNAVRVVANAQNADGPPSIVSAAPSPSSLDDWVVAREGRFNDSQAQRYVSPNMTGYEDLDANGRWATEADVGPVWYPTTYVRTDWAPYRYGRWAYVAPWGYTWIDDAPWGFAPFHYGRWIEVGGRWGWAPGAFVARPVFAPALVGFYGGAGFSASFSVGVGPAVGWYPLAPWERFTPHYAHSTTYINQVNNITIVNAPARFASREGGWNREHGATVVPQDAFASQRSISRVATAAPRGAFDRATVINPAELPRPAAIPGAVRRGPEAGNGIARPEFRSPREFAQRPEVREGRPNEAARAQPSAAPAERSTLPPNYRRLPEAPRAPTTAEAPRPFQTNQDVGPVAERAQERAAQQQRGPNAPNFNREGRAVAQPPPLPSVENPNPVAPSAQRFGPRQQAMQRGEGAAVAPAQAGERPAREFRAPQPPSGAPAPAAQPQPADRQQRQERQRIERPAVPAAAPVAPPAPVAAPHPVPVPAAAAPQPHPPRAEPAERGGEKGPAKERDR